MKKVSALLFCLLAMGLVTPAAFAEGMGVEDDETYMSDMPEEEFVEDEDAGYIDEVEDVEESIRNSREAVGKDDARNPDMEW